jgi:hypothetical protein
MELCDVSIRDDDYETTRTLGAAYIDLFNLLKDKNTSLARLRKMLFGASTEKTKSVIGGNDLKTEFCYNVYPNKDLSKNGEDRIRTCGPVSRSSV